MSKLIFRKSLLLENTGVGAEFYAGTTWADKFDGHEVFKNQDCAGYGFVYNDGIYQGIAESWIEEQE